MGTPGIEKPAERNWDERYRSGQTPWDTGNPSVELTRVLDEKLVPPCRALELGCGTGTNAIFLAQRGFHVTAADSSSVALDRARHRATEKRVRVNFVLSDVCRLPCPQTPFDFVFDRGCYHCVRETNLEGFLSMLARVTAPGSKFLVLAGNKKERTEVGPPRVSEDEMRSELGPLFDVDFIREFRFTDPGDTAGPLAWSCLLTRRAADGS